MNTHLQALLSYLVLNPILNINFCERMALAPLIQISDFCERHARIILLTSVGLAQANPIIFIFANKLTNEQIPLMKCQ